jgi:uncharacterized membrane protein YdjX (TVP38/TMEM64 family)
VSTANLVRAISIVILLTTAVAAYQVVPVGTFEMVVAWARENPVAGGVLYVVFVSIATVALVPGSVSMMLGGFLFGVLSGSAYAMAGIVIGAQLAFYTSRLIARPWVEERVHSDKRLHAVEMAIDQQAFTLVLLTRLALLIPFNLLNYVYGVTSVRPVTYLRATAAGMLPAVVLGVYMGSLARDLGEVLSGEATPSGFAYLIAAGGLIVIATVTWLIHRAAGRALRSHLQQP